LHNLVFLLRFKSDNRFIGCQDVQSAIKSLFSGHIVYGMVSKAAQYLSLSSNSMPPPGHQYAWRRQEPVDVDELRRDINVSYVRLAMQQAIARFDHPITSGAGHNNGTRAAIYMRMGAPMYLTGALIYLLDLLTAAPECVTCDATADGHRCTSCGYNKPTVVVAQDAYGGRYRRRVPQRQQRLKTGGDAVKPKLPCAVSCVFIIHFSFFPSQPPNLILSIQ
jgi:hypothetical protein